MQAVKGAGKKAKERSVSQSRVGRESSQNKQQTGEKFDRRAATADLRGEGEGLAWRGTLKLIFLTRSEDGLKRTGKGLVW